MSELKRGPPGNVNTLITKFDETGLRRVDETNKQINFQVLLLSFKQNLEVI